MPNPGVTTLGTLRAAAQQRVDMTNSGFISTAQWNAMINASIQELYDLLTTKFEFYYMVNPPSTFTTDGTSQLYTLPTDFYKLYGVDLVLLPGSGSASFITLKSFPFGERNKYAIPNYQTYFGVTNLQYTLVQSNPGSLMFIPIPQANQTIKVWYAPRFTALVNDADTFDGINGWEEYVVVDAAIKARIQEESDIQPLLLQKAAMVQRINDTAANRDVGSPAKITDVNSSQFGYPGGVWGSGAW